MRKTPVMIALQFCADDASTARARYTRSAERKAGRASHASLGPDRSSARLQAFVCRGRPALRSDYFSCFLSERIRLRTQLYPGAPQKWQLGKKPKRVKHED